MEPRPAEAQPEAKPEAKPVFLGGRRQERKHVL